MWFPLTGPTCQNPIFPIPWTLQGQSNESTRHHTSHWYMGTPHLFSMLLKGVFYLLWGNSLQSVACFQTIFSNGISWSFVGEIWVFGNNKCLLEPSLVNILGNEAEKYCSVSKMENTIHLMFLSGPFSSGPQVSGTRIVTPNEVSHTFWNLHTPYAETSVAPLNGKQLCPLVCFVPLFGPSSEQRCIIQCFLHREFSWGRSCFSGQLLFGIQKTIPKLHIHIFNWAETILPLSPYSLHTIALPLSGFDPRVRTILFSNTIPVIQ